MGNSLYVAFHYIKYNRLKTLILVCCITLIAFLPLSLQVLIEESERQLMDRAVSTPLLIGAKGSSLDLAMNSLYFTRESPELIDMGAVTRIDETELALAIPLYVRFQARSMPIVGTSLDYFEHRELAVAEGRQFARVGECILGARAARDLEIGVGDTIVSSPENMFDLAGIYPLKMQVVGVLQENFSADDLAIFTDLKTTWVIQGLGHGHNDVTKIKDSTLIMKRTDENVTASVKLFHYTEITEDNIDSFHFHGSTDQYPITAILAAPFDDKSKAILQGRFLGKEELLQIFSPKVVIGELLENIFRIKHVLDAIISVVSGVTLLAIGLVFGLSLRLRQKEVETIFKIGCDRAMIFQLLGAEIFLIMLMSAILCTFLLLGTQYFSADLVRLLFLQ